MQSAVPSWPLAVHKHKTHRLASAGTSTWEILVLASLGKVLDTYQGVIATPRHQYELHVIVPRHKGGFPKRSFVLNN